MGEKYQGVIWTDHALRRMKERGIKIDHALTTLNSPDESRRGQIPGSWVYFRTWGEDQIEVVAKQNERGEWVVLSVWSRKVKNSNWSGKLPWWKYFLKELLGR